MTLFNFSEDAPGMSCNNISGLCRNMETAIALPDEHYQMMEDILKRAGRKGKWMKDRSGVWMKFYLSKGKITAHKRIEGGYKKMDVLKLSDAQQHQVQANPIREDIRTRIKNDNTNMTDEELDATADILTEANETIKRLVKNGVDINTATRIVQVALDHKEESNATALAQSLKQKELLFGNPKSPNYGAD